MNANARKPLSVWAVISFLLMLTVVPSWFMCLPITGPLSILCGIVGLSEFRRGKVNDASKTLSGASILLSAILFVGTPVVTVFGFGVTMAVFGERTDKSVDSFPEVKEPTPAPAKENTP